MSALKWSILLFCNHLPRWGLKIVRRTTDGYMICRIVEKAWIISQAHGMLGCGKTKKQQRINTTNFYLFFQAPFPCRHQWALLLLS